MSLPPSDRHPDAPLPIEKCPYCGKDRALLTISEATGIATVNRKTIYRWIKNGTLEHCILPSGAVRIFKDSLIRIPGVPGEHEHAEDALAPGVAVDAGAARGSGKAKPARTGAGERPRSKGKRPDGLP